MLQQPDLKILQRIAVSDEQAFKIVYDDYAPAVFNAAMVYLRDEEPAKEIVQLTFIKFWEKRQTILEIRSLENYLFIIARNLIYDLFKKRVREKHLLAQFREEQEESISDSDLRLMEHEYEELYTSAISKLPPQQQKAYVLRKKENLDYDQIASQMGISRNTVKKHLELANQSIRQFVKSRLTGFVATIMLFLK